MTLEPGPTRHAFVVGTYVDGGAVLVDRPYGDAAWRQVREGWWWHLAGTILLLPVYGVVALTVWQRPSRQSLGRRVGWAVLLTSGALLLVGLPAFVAFSRRWYWLYRTGARPEALGLGEAPPDPRCGHLAWVAARGATVVDAVVGVGRRRTGRLPVAVQFLAAPWGPLRREALAAAHRLVPAGAAADGAAGEAIARARREAEQAVEAIDRLAERGAALDRALDAADVAAVRRRLDALPVGRGSTEDLGAAGRSLHEQLAAHERMAAMAVDLEGRLHRTVAQLGEAAARAEELALCPAGGSTVPSVALARAADDLTAIRRALEDVEQVDLAPTLVHA